MSDAAKAGDWATILRALESVSANPNQWRIRDTSYFAPLHQVAFLGAPVEVALQLIDRGAWRYLRDADGQKPIDIARARGHDHLFEVLEAPDHAEWLVERFALWDTHLESAIQHGAAEFKHGMHRPVSSQVLFTSVRAPTASCSSSPTRSVASPVLGGLVAWLIFGVWHPSNSRPGRHACGRGVGCKLIRLHRA